MALARLSFRKSKREKNEQLELKRQKSQQDVKYIIGELLETEENYIKKLNVIIDGYMQQFREPNPSVPIPDDLKIRARLIFNNIEDIYSFHKEYFLKLLQDNQHSPIEVAKQFLRCESQFHMYSKYCSKKDYSAPIIRQYSDYFNKISRELGEKQPIDSLLMQPTQRIIHYKNMLERLVDKVHSIDKENTLIDEALEVIGRIVAEADNYKCVDGIFNYPGDITEQGKLIHHDFLNCKYKKKSVRLYVFLFKRILLFTEKTKSANVYSYKMQIPTNKFKIEKGNPFTITSTEPNSNMTIVCRGDTPESNHNWLEKIQNELKLHAELAAELENPSEDFLV
ncbi:rho guanine nucleotide exchange factor 25-like [Musca autumnalis]|uniref:rho guanine nucleotide exchange factor 25-like n=1 Tax=Musca autumnalis TaxID=221902 RepID=UPI003CED80E0